MNIVDLPFPQNGIDNDIIKPALSEKKLSALLSLFDEIKDEFQFYEEDPESYALTSEMQFIVQTILKSDTPE